MHCSHGEIRTSVTRSECDNPLQFGSEEQLGEEDVLGVLSTRRRVKVAGDGFEPFPIFYYTIR